MRRAPIVLAVLLALAAALPASAPAARHHRARSVRPQTFRSCAGLVRYARTHFTVTKGVPEPTVRPLQTPSPAPPSGKVTPQATSSPESPSGGSSTFSTTNVQEPGVDEPDIVKTDGSTIFALSGDRIEAVDVRGAAPRLAGTLSVPGAGSGAQLLLRGTRLIVISGGPTVVPLGTREPPGATIQPSPYWRPARTTVTEVDVHDPTAMRITRTLTVDGTFVDARLNGATARLVIASAPPAILRPAARTRASGWIPVRRFRSRLTGRRYARPVARCTAIRHPVRFSGLGMLTIMTIDLDRGLWAADTDALMADAQVVYGSPTSLYVATQRWIAPRTKVADLPTAQATVIQRFDVTDPDRTTLVAAGAVPGYVLNQYSLSEYQGNLRVATTTEPEWWTGEQPPSSESRVTVLADHAGTLTPIGSVGGLGAGQQIRSVRFLGDTAYVVTFRQVDPLYTIDLSDPSAPRVAGQLELQGYSAYLHPVGPGLLLGVGRDVSSQNEPDGVQLELFDVSDAAAPKLLARTTIADASTQVEFDPHAFLFWPPSALAVVPVQTFQTPVFVPPTGGAPRAVPQEQQGFTGAIGYHVDASGIAEVGRVAHDGVDGASPPIQRAVVVGDRLFTISDSGVMASRLDTLAREAFVAFSP